MPGLLDHRGRSIGRTAQRSGVDPRAFRDRLSAHYDAARTTDDNERHWANADGLSADASANPAVRAKIRNRARYEAQQSNSYAKGMVLTLANECVGTGPRLQLLTDDSDYNTFVEQQFSQWVRATRYVSKLRTGRVSRAVDGEKFALFVNDDRLPTPVKLNVVNVECDRVYSPLSALGRTDPNVADGVRFHAGTDVPAAYWVADRHPGDALAGVERGRWVPAEQVIHRLRRDRPGQTRGVSELAPALPLFAMLRRYTLATLAAAETAADFAAVLYSDLPETDEAETLGRDEWFEAIPIEYRAMLTLPQGYKLGQMKAEQPVTTYAEFKREILSEISRCLMMPRNVAAADSSDHNYASGRLDKQTFDRAVEVDRADDEIEDVDRTFAEWFAEARTADAPGYRDFMPGGRDTPLPPHRWFWPAPKHVDPQKEANAAVTLWEAGLLTDDEYLFREGVDPDEHYAKLAEMVKRRRGLGLPLPGGVTLPPGTAPERQRGAVGATLAAAGPAQDLRATPSASGDLQIEAKAAGDGGPPKLATFQLTAYNGGPMQLGRRHPVVIDLGTMAVSAKSRPVLRDHDPGRIVGHTAGENGNGVVNDGRTLRVSGVVSAANADAGEIVAAAINGFPWQVSGGWSLTRPFEEIKAGRTAAVNGRTVKGPALIARHTVFNESSFVALGADDTTAADVAASFNPDAEGEEMKFDEWLKAKGFDAPDKLTDAQRAGLKASFDAEAAAAEPKDEAVGDGKGEARELKAVKAAAGSGDVSDDAPDPAAELRAAAAAESRRVGAIRLIASQFPDVKIKAADGSEDSLEAHAIERGWDANTAELHARRLSRPAVTARRAEVPGGDEAGDVLTASMLRASGMAEAVVAEQFPTDRRERVMNAAAAADNRGAGVHTLLDRVIQASGNHFNGSRRSDDFIKAAFAADRQLQAGGFTTLSLATVLGDVANRTMLAAYNAQAATWRAFCGVRQHTDFRRRDFVRPELTGGFREVAADGELKHVGMVETSFGTTLNTYGAIIGLTRKDIINDDLGAFLRVPTALGQMGGERIEEEVYVTLLGNPGGFFSVGNGNLVSGAESALSIDGLTLAETKFGNQVSAAGRPRLLTPDRILVPTTLDAQARKLFNQTTIVPGVTAGDSAFNNNQHAGKYSPTKSPYLNNTAVRDVEGRPLSGQSDAHWYMFANPAIAAAISVSFLNGQETPTVDSSDAEFHQLGVYFRGYIDFGVGMEDTNAAVRVVGA